MSVGARLQKFLISRRLVQAREASGLFVCEEEAGEWGVRERKGWLVSCLQNQCCDIIVPCLWSCDSRLIKTEDQISSSEALVCNLRQTGNIPSKQLCSCQAYVFLLLPYPRHSFCTTIAPHDELVLNQQPPFAWSRTFHLHLYYVFLILLHLCSFFKGP